MMNFGIDNFEFALGSLTPIRTIRRRKRKLYFNEEKLFELGLGE